MVRVDVEPELLKWARERSALEIEDLSSRFPRLSEWEAGAAQPTLKQLEAFASATHTALGLLLLPEPPHESVPIPDFRTVGDQAVRRPSPDLLDTIFLCQQRQEWYRDYALSNGEDPLGFVGSLDTSTAVLVAAAAMQDALAFGIDQRHRFASWSAALSGLADQAEATGVLVMVNGVVGSNTHRVLDPQEFRGFALVDGIAPVVFVNGADTKAAQIFTLAHELAHVWLGQSALSSPNLAAAPSNDVERWCNQVAAEFLVPLQAIRAEHRPSEDLTSELSRLAHRFKVSTLVVLRRVRDADLLPHGEFDDAYRAELARVMGLRARGSGGNFYNTQPVRVSKRFARAIIGSTLEGQTLHRDAFHLLGFKKVSTFHEIGHRLGVM